MNVRQRKKVIWLTAVVVGVASLVLLFTGFCVPIKTTKSKTVFQSEVSATAGVFGETSNDKENTNVSNLSFDELKRLCEKNLRKPLYDKPIPEPEKSDAASSASNSSLPLRLIGTANEPGHSIAMFQKSDGSIELCVENENMDNAGETVTVIKIEHQKVIVEYGGETYELVIPENGKALDGK